LHRKTICCATTGRKFGHASRAPRLAENFKFDRYSHLTPSKQSDLIPSGLASSRLHATCTVQSSLNAFERLLRWNLKGSRERKLPCGLASEARRLRCMAVVFYAAWRSYFERLLATWLCRIFRCAVVKVTDPVFTFQHSDQSLLESLSMQRARHRVR
jgi:hypothetical protein